ncbi:MAG: hypothetical protein JWN04_1143 [Myxococcaceae bacterium]|nr:hypothetical protein [Myxococcaceae bacterium]
MRMWLGGGLAVVLIVTWVVAHLVMKVTSMAIHLLLIGAVVVLVANVVGRIRQGSGPQQGP